MYNVITRVTPMGPRVRFDADDVRLIETCVDGFSLDGWQIQIIRTRN